MTRTARSVILFPAAVYIFWKVLWYFGWERCALPPEGNICTVLYGATLLRIFVVGGATAAVIGLGLSRRVDD